MPRIFDHGICGLVSAMSAGTRPAASAITARFYSRHCLGGTDGLREDAFTELTAQPAHRDKVDLGAQQPLKAFLKFKHAKVAQFRAGLVVNEHIDITPSLSLVTRHGTKDGQLANAHGGEVITMRSEYAKNVVSFHSGPPLDVPILAHGADPSHGDLIVCLAMVASGSSDF
jgi:hypothetical protein